MQTAPPPASRESAPSGRKAPARLTPIPAPQSSAPLGTMDAPGEQVVSTSRRRRSYAPLAQRARSVPYMRPYVVAIFLSALFYLALIGALAALIAFMIQQNKTSATLLVAFGGTSSFLWLISFFKRRSCHCPLCKGTPYLDSGAHYHQKAVRLLPLNHGHTNVVRSLVRQQFRCQFCGTPFDLLKPKG